MNFSSVRRGCPWRGAGTRSAGGAEGGRGPSAPGVWFDFVRVTQVAIPLPRLNLQIRGMPRKRRIHAPTAGFHITARTQEGARWFDEELRSDVVAIICEGALTFGHNLLAYVVMPNHFHMVVRQGDHPVSWMMQRIMLRIAVRVQKKFDHAGHVFGRPYWASICNDPGYLRRAIVYTHLNPCKAGLCEAPESYQWSSHRAYLEDCHAQSGFSPLHGLLLFADQSIEAADAILSYMRFVDFVVERRRTGVPGDWLMPRGPDRMLIPLARHGDAHWAITYSQIASASFERMVLTPITDQAAAILRRIDPGCDLETLQNGGRRKALNALRRQVAIALISSGYRTGLIARCLRVCPSYVSHLRTCMRETAAHQLSNRTPICTTT